MSVIEMTYSEYIFDYGNPYSINEIEEANEFLLERIRSYKLEWDLAVYLIPVRKGANRLLFIPIHPDYHPSKEILTSMRHELDYFLTDITSKRNALIRAHENEKQPSK